MKTFVKLTPTKTVAGVLAAFNKAITDLRTVENQQRAEADRQLEVANDAQMKADAAEREANKASAIGTKLEELLNG
jgi:hypothetical protein